MRRHRAVIFLKGIRKNVVAKPVPKAPDRGGQPLKINTVTVDIETGQHLLDECTFDCQCCKRQVTGLVHRFICNSILSNKQRTDYATGSYCSVACLNTALCLDYKLMSSYKNPYINSPCCLRHTNRRLEHLGFSPIRPRVDK